MSYRLSALINGLNKMSFCRALNLHLGPSERQGPLESGRDPHWPDPGYAPGRHIAALGKHLAAQKMHYAALGRHHAALEKYFAVIRRRLVAS